MHLKLFFHTIGLFVGGQLLALVVSQQLKSIAPLGELTTSRGVFDILSFLMLFFAATLFLVVLFQLHKGRLVYRSVFIVLTFLGLFKLFELVFPSSLSALVAGVFILALYIVPTVWAHNLIVLLASSGIGPLFGMQLRWDFAAAVLVVLSIYDVVAVYVTKHMVELSHAMIKHQASFALLVPERMRQFSTSLFEVKPGSGFLIFGGGDVIMPMIFLVSVFMASSTFAFWALGGMVLGILLNHLLLVHYRHPLPALPLIALGAFIGIAGGFLAVFAKTFFI